MTKALIKASTPYEVHTKVCLIAVFCAGVQGVVGDLQCVGQGQQQPAQGLPSLCPPAEDDLQMAPQQPSQQAGASAELVDGYQLHITGDAMDAVQSPVCASAQVCKSA